MLPSGAMQIPDKKRLQRRGGRRPQIPWSPAGAAGDPTASSERFMLIFRYACPHHRRIFIDAAKRGGCYDPEQIDEVRRKALAWLSTQFPRAVLDHFNEETCLGCKLEANYLDVSELEHIIVELSRTVAS